MYEIIEEFRVGEYVLLYFDRPITDRAYRRIEIDGVIHDLVPCFDLPPNIAVKSKDSFVGKKARLVL